MNNIIKTRLDEYRARLVTIISQPIVKIIFFSTIIINVLGLVFIVIIFNQLPQQIPLYYSRPWGEDQITAPIFIFILPLGSLLFHLATCVLIIAETHRYRVYAQLLLAFSFVVAILSSFTIYNIVRLIL